MHFPNMIPLYAITFFQLAIALIYSTPDTKLSGIGNLVKDNGTNTLVTAVQGGLDHIHQSYPNTTLSLININLIEPFEKPVMELLDMTQMFLACVDPKDLPFSNYSVRDYETETTYTWDDWDKPTVKSGRFFPELGAIDLQSVKLSLSDADVKIRDTLGYYGYYGYASVAFYPAYNPNPIYIIGLTDDQHAYVDALDGRVWGEDTVAGGVHMKDPMMQRLKKGKPSSVA